MKKTALFICLILTFAILLASCADVADTSSSDASSQISSEPDVSSPVVSEMPSDDTESKDDKQVIAEYCDGTYRLLQVGDERILYNGEKQLFGLMGDTQISEITYYESVDRAVASLESDNVEIRISFGDEKSRVLRGDADILFDNRGNIYTVPKDYVEIKWSAGDNFIAKDSGRMYRIIDKDGNAVSDTYSSFYICQCNKDIQLYHIVDSKGDHKAVTFDGDGNVTEYHYESNEHMGSYKDAGIKAFDKVIGDIKSKDRAAMAEYFTQDNLLENAFAKLGTDVDPTSESDDALAWVIDHADEYLAEGKYDVETECVHPDNGLKTVMSVRCFAEISDELTYEISFVCTLEYQDGQFNVLKTSLCVEEI